jgi:hypothetical protein
VLAWWAGDAQRRRRRRRWRNSSKQTQRTRRRRRRRRRSRRRGRRIQEVHVQGLFLRLLVGLDMVAAHGCV